MIKDGGSAATIIIGLSKSVLFYALHSIVCVQGLARFRVLVPNYYYYYEKYAACFYAFPFYSIYKKLLICMRNSEKHKLKTNDLRCNIEPLLCRLLMIRIYIYKSGCKEDIRNYRPISKLSCIPKLFESIITNKIAPHINKWLSECQHGFRAGRSTVTNCSVITSSIILNIDCRQM